VAMKATRSNAGRRESSSLQVSPETLTKWSRRSETTDGGNTQNIVELRRIPLMSGLEQPAVSSEREVFCADMTQLIAADSRVHQPGVFLIDPREPRSVLCDPMATDAFELLTTIVCNDTFVYFKRPTRFAYDLTPVMKAWQKAADETERQRTDIKHQRIFDVPPSSLEQRAGRMVDSYVHWLGRDGHSRLLAHWVAFQTGQRCLMEQFWDNNSADDVLRMLEFLRSQGNPDSHLEHELLHFGVAVDPISAEYVVGLSGLEFGRAYAFWAFAKGYRYAARLPQENIYAVHWLREDAIEAGADVIQCLDEPAPRYLFPWGVFLSSLTDVGCQLAPDEMAEVLPKLRAFTQHELPRLGRVENLSERNLHRVGIEFIAEALTDAMPVGWERRPAARYALPFLTNGLWYSYVWTILRELASFSPAEPIIRLLKLLPQDFEETNEAVRHTVRLVRYRQLASALLLRHRTDLQAFFDAKGWT
jgi:hypothetical protein